MRVHKPNPGGPVLSACILAALLAMPFSATFGQNVGETGVATVPVKSTRLLAIWGKCRLAQWKIKNRVQRAIR